MNRIELRYPKREPSAEERFLDKFVFYGLTNLNKGFDAMSIRYFNQAEFKTVLERCEKLKISIYGIEPWLDGSFFWVVTVSDTGLEASDQAWYNKAFEKFASQEPDLQYAASYGIPGQLLEEFLKEEAKVGK